MREAGLWGLEVQERGLEVKRFKALGFRVQGLGFRLKGSKIKGCCCLLLGHL